MDTSMRLRARKDGYVTSAGYVVSMFPYGVASFAVLLAGFVVGVAGLVLGVGVPVLGGMLHVARGFAAAERRALQRVTGTDPVPVHYRRPPAGAGRWRRSITPLTDPQSWLDFGHGLLALITGLVAFVLVVAWSIAALAGVTWALWSWALPNGPGDKRLHQLLGLPDSALVDFGFHTGIGLVVLILLPAVSRGAALLRARTARGMLLAVADLREQISGLEEEKADAQARTVAAVSAEASALRRLERDIHDGPQQRLVRLAMDLGRARHQLSTDPAAAGRILGDALTQTRETLDELRALSRGIAPPVLADRGLVAAVAALAGRSTVPVHVDGTALGATRLDPAVENAAYFVIAESLTNVAKHSAATECVVTLRREPTRLVVEVRDDGLGGAHLAKGHGLAGLTDRVRALGGGLSVDSPAGGPTAVTAELPCGS